MTGCTVEKTMQLRVAQRTASRLRHGDGSVSATAQPSGERADAPVERRDVAAVGGTCDGGHAAPCLGSRRRLGRRLVASARWPVSSGTRRRGWARATLCVGHEIGVVEDAQRVEHHAGAAVDVDSHVRPSPSSSVDADTGSSGRGLRGVRRRPWRSRRRWRPMRGLELGRRCPRRSPGRGRSPRCGRRAGRPPRGTAW